MIKFAKIYTSLCYVGYIKPGSGTVGSIVSILIIYNLMNHLNHFNFIILFVFLLFLSNKFIDVYSSSTNSHDSSKIVIDEFLGIFFIMIFYDFFIFLNNWTMLILIFVLFRIFDILKPYPINWIDQNIKNSWGVILDDIFAGIYCVIVLSFINAII